MRSRFVLIVLSCLLLLGASCSIDKVDQSIQRMPTDIPTITPTVNPYEGIMHIDKPGEAVFLKAQLAYDCNTGYYTPVGNPANIGFGCNRWDDNLLELPTNPLGDMYFPHLDIIRMRMGEDESWYYARFSTYSTEVADPVLDAMYGMEIDFELDGRGNLLILVRNPSDFVTGEWSVEGVQIWRDMNGDVGAEIPVYADDTNPGDGYEMMVFDQGLGNDPDLAWARISPKDPGAIEFAFKRSLLEEDNGEFLW